MLILGVDTSCDDTSIATLKIKNQKSKIKNIEVLSSVVSSQEKLHTKYGGVWPAMAQREHEKNLVFVLEKALKEAKSIGQKENGNGKKITEKKQKTLSKILEREPLLKENLLKFLNKYQKPKIEAIAVTIGPGLEPCLWQGLNFAKALL